MPNEMKMGGIPVFKKIPILACMAYNQLLTPARKRLSFHMDIVLNQRSHAANMLGNATAEKAAKGVFLWEKEIASLKLFAPFKCNASLRLLILQGDGRQAAKSHSVRRVRRRHRTLEDLQSTLSFGRPLE